MLRDPARGTSQLYLRVAWTSAFKQFFIIFNLHLPFFIFSFPPLHNFVISPLNFLFPRAQFYHFPSSTILLFFLLLINFFLFPPSQFYYLIPSSFLNSLLLYNSKFFQPPLLLEFLPPQFLLFSLLNLDFHPPPPPPHLFYIFFHPQIRRPHIDPTSTLNSTFFQHSFVNSETIYNYDHHMSIVFSPPSSSPPPPPHFYRFLSTTIVFTPPFILVGRLFGSGFFNIELGLFGLGLAWLTFYINLSAGKIKEGVKTIEMCWWWWR